MKEIRVAYHHLPKCGGFTIGEVNARIKIDIDENKYKFIYKKSNHCRLTQFIKTLGKENQPIFLFTFVRNPYDRLVSAWNFLISQIKYNPISYESFESVNFRDKIRNTFDRNANNKGPVRMSFLYRIAAERLIDKYSNLNNFVKDKEYFKMFMESRDLFMFRPMSFFCNDMIKYNKIYKFENIEKEICQYLEDIGLSNDVQIQVPHRNKSDQNFKLDDLTEETKSIIYDLYKNDFELFGYKK